MLKSFWLLVLSIVTCYGAFNADSTHHGTATIPNSAPFTTIASSGYTMEFGLSAWTVPMSSCITVYAPISGSIFGGICSDGKLYLRDTLDNFGGQSFFIAMDLTGRTAVRVRLQRRATNANVTDCPCILGEMWNDDGTGYASGQSNIMAIVPITLSNTEFVGAGSATFTITFARLIAGEVQTNKYTLNTQPPQAFHQANSILEYLFNGNGNDTGSAGINLTIAGASPVFPANPTGPPVCLLTRQSFPSTAGLAQLNGTLSYPRDGGTTLTYSWSQPSGTWTPTLSSTTAQNPTFTVTQFGSVNFQLTVTDGSSQSTSCTIHDGTTTPNANGIIHPVDPDGMGRGFLDAIMTGKAGLIPWGQNPWPWFDDRNVYLGKFFGDQVLTNTNTWATTPAPGLVSINTGSTTLNGNGSATFLSTFNCSPVGGNVDYAVIYYTHTPPNGVASTHYAQIGVTGCANNNQLTLAAPWPVALGNLTNVQYSVITLAQEGYWAANSTSVQFYDGALAYYNTYYRSGFDDYLTYANTLADQWWTWPSINKGQLCDGSGVTAPQCPSPRNMSLTGVFIRALVIGDTSSSSMWPGLEEIGNNLGSQLLACGGYQVNKGTGGACTVNPFISDVREWSYAWSWISDLGIADPNPTNKATFAAMLTTNPSVPLLAPITLLTNTQQADKSWLNVSVDTTIQINTWQATATGTVTVATGSPTVTGSGTNFAACLALASGNPAANPIYLWTTTPASATVIPPDNTQGDSTAIRISSISGTTITLVSNYLDTPVNLSGRGWQCANQFTGSGAQPFMQLGIMTRAFSTMSWASAINGDATNAAKFKQFAMDEWTSYGHNFAIQYFENGVTANAIYYGTTFTNCGSPPVIIACNKLVDSTGAPLTTGVAIQNARFLDTEAMGAGGMSYSYSGSVNTLNDINKLYGGLYGGFGGPNADANYISGNFGTYNYVGDDVAFSKNKDFDFVYGWGAGAIWPAAMLTNFNGTPTASTLNNKQVINNKQVAH